MLHYFLYCDNSDIQITVEQSFPVEFVELNWEMFSHKMKGSFYQWSNDYSINYFSSIAVQQFYSTADPAGHTS